MKKNMISSSIETRFSEKNWNEAQLSLAVTLLEELPPIIARHQVDTFLGGLITGKTLRNLDHLGKGPEVAWRIGARVAYKTDSLVEWLIDNYTITKKVCLNAL